MMMYSKTNFIISGLIFSFLVMGCSNPSDSGNNDVFIDVPSGEIVPVAERDLVLTGFESSSKQAKSTKSSQKYWKYIKGVMSFDGCDVEDDTIETDENLYLAFAPNGDILYRSGSTGEGQSLKTWAWANSDKNSIYIDNETSVDFEIRALNENEVVYASYQRGEGGCNLITWEQLKSQ